MRKLNNKGFMLVETLIVAVFLVTIFSILYNNFYPLIGEYERREYYDDIDSKYSIYWIKRMIQDGGYSFTDSDKNVINSGAKYVEFNCSKFANADKNAVCKEMVSRLNLVKAYIISYTTTNFKNVVKNNEAFDKMVVDGVTHNVDFRDYIAYLAEFSKGSLNRANYRVVGVFHNTKDDNDFYTYATIEVKR